METQRPALDAQLLSQQNQQFLNCGGRSQENHDEGFRPAFLDTISGRAYPSCFADGSPASFHLLDGLPNALVGRRNRHGDVSSALPTVIAGFLRGQRFYTRAEAAQAVGRH